MLIVYCNAHYFLQMLWGGKVHKPEVTDTSTVALREIAKKVHADDRVFVSFLVIGDGTMLVFKK